LTQKPIFLNGRFLSQTMTGVQRFSAEIAIAIDGLMEKGAWPETTMLAPRAASSTASREISSSYTRLGLQEIGHSKGHLWEQTELAAAAREGMLISLGNTAPLLAGRNQVVVIHDAGVFDTPESYSWRFRAWYKSLQYGLSRSGAQIVTVSRFSRDRIAARLRLDPARIGVMYEGAEHILRNPADPGTLERHNLVRGKFALVVSSRVPHKNLAALHEAAAALARRGIVIAVAGASDRNVFQEIGEVGFAENRLGRVSDAELRALYENAACLLFPSRYEGFGLPPVEAMACGCPVLATRGGAVEEVCGDSALYFDIGDRHAIIDTVERLLDEPGLASALRTSGLSRASILTWDAAARLLGDIVQHRPAISSGNPAKRNSAKTSAHSLPGH